MTINRNLSILANGVFSTGVLGVPNGGSGATTLTGYLIGNGTSAFTASATIPTSALSGTVNLTSQVSGILPVANGGTGLTTLTAGYIPYGNGTSAFSSSSTLTYNGTTLSAGNFVPSSSTTPSNGMYLAGANQLGFATNSALAMEIGSTGGVSIGNTIDPGATNLSVTGVIKIGTKQAVNGPAFSAFQNSTQSISSSTSTKVLFPSTVFDTAGVFASSTFTPNVGGYYQVNANISFSFVAGPIVFNIYKNGGAEVYNTLSVANANGVFAFLSSLIKMNGTTDYIEVYVTQYSGTTQTPGSGSNTYFQASMVRGL